MASMLGATGDRVVPILSRFLPSANWVAYPQSQNSKGSSALRVHLRPQVSSSKCLPGPPLPTMKACPIRTGPPCIPSLTTCSVPGSSDGKKENMRETCSEATDCRLNRAREAAVRGETDVVGVGRQARICDLRTDLSVRQPQKNICYIFKTW